MSEPKPIRSSDLMAMGLCPSVHNAVRVPGEDKGERLAETRSRIQWPVQSKAIRLEMIKQGKCTECGGELDTGFECNDCNHDALEEAQQIAPDTPCA